MLVIRDYAIGILLLEFYWKYASHMTKSCMLKIVNLKQNVDFNLAEVTEKLFQPPKFILKSLKLIY